jgi:prophage DNA circulation protein
VLVAETPVSLIAVLVLQACVAFSLQQMSLALTAVAFTSREDVDAVLPEINAAFDQAEEAAADAMALTAYRMLIALHAATTYFLFQTAQPLPQMLDFQFAAVRPTLIQSYRLYADASRADQLRDENKVVHPAFAPRQGQALSF